MTDYKLTLHDCCNNSSILINKVESGDIVLTLSTQVPIDFYGIEWKDNKSDVMLSKSEASVLLNMLVDVLYPKEREL